MMKIWNDSKYPEQTEAALLCAKLQKNWQPWKFENMINFNYFFSRLGISLNMIFFVIINMSCFFFYTLTKLNPKPLNICNETEKCDI